MEIRYVFEQKRRFYGAPCHFKDVGPVLLVDIDPEPKDFEQYEPLKKYDKSTLCRAELAQHEVNTVTAFSECKGINHEVGGWPADVDPRDEEHTSRFKKKIEKEDFYNATVVEIGQLAERLVMENNAIDIYETYFSDSKVHFPEDDESAHLRTVSIFKDHLEGKRCVSDITWSSDMKKLIVSYVPHDCSYITKINSDNYDCSIWAIEDTIAPKFNLKCFDPVTCISFSPFDEDIVVAGFNNGQVISWVLSEKDEYPKQLSVLEDSHQKPVTKIKWLPSKSRSEFITSSNDGCVLSWDIRDLSKPTGGTAFDPKEIPNCPCLEDVTFNCVEYDSTVPLTFLAGSTEGLIVNCDRLENEPSEMYLDVYNTEAGPILNLERNPYISKLFMCCSASVISIWAEHVTNESVMSIRAQTGRFTDATWCPMRPSVIFTTKSDGFLEAWDILLKHNEPIAIQKMYEDCLTCVRAVDDHDRIACGSSTGNVHILQLPKYYHYINKREKMYLMSITVRDGKTEDLPEPMTRRHRLEVQAEQRKVADGEWVELQRIPVVWREDEKGEDMYAEMEKFEYETGFLKPKEVEEGLLKLAEKLNIEEETGERVFLEKLGREVQAKKLLDETLVKVVTAREADNTNFPYLEFEIEEEYGEEEFLKKLEIDSSTLMAVTDLVERVTSL